MAVSSGSHRADPARRPVLFINPNSGGGKAVQSGLTEQARKRGIEAIVLAEDQNLASAVREAAAGGADALGMAGGDGSLAAVAATAAEYDVPFVCVPAGTRNHFALDVGVDRRDLIGALDAFSNGVERRIDLAEVNGLTFLNNVSLGIYGDAVRRSAYRDAKVRTVLETADEAMHQGAALPALQLVDDLGRAHDRLAIVVVSNNPYALDYPLARGTRPALDTGRLGILLLDVPGENHRSLRRIWTAPHLEMTAAQVVHAGVDGEAIDLGSPLRFAIRPRALRVLISSRHPAMSPSARYLGAPPVRLSRHGS